jgi:hypothetical protein
MRTKVHKWGSALLLAVVMTAGLSSCIKEEALNAEADITGVSLGADSLLIRQPEIGNNEITIYANTRDSILAPQFTLTDGATIEPASGTERQFFKRVPNPDKTSEDDALPDSIDEATPQTYTVTSQDGKWKKTYTVRIANNATPSDFHFDNIRYYMYDADYDGKDDPLFQIFYEKIGGQQVDWGSGNPGVMITLMASNPKPTDYPTSQADDGVEGKCAKLTTVSTGALGVMFHSPIAAGNIFLGTFSIDMEDKAKSTHFGIPFFNTKPLSLTGYYKYKAGPTVTDKNMKPVSGAKDDFALYAVVFEVTKDVPYLDGTDTDRSSTKSPNIVLKAELTDRKETDEWTKFTIPFEPMNGKTFDINKMIQGKYSIAIIASSSKDGATFRGAVGSTLYLDEFHINYEAY